MEYFFNTSLSLSFSNHAPIDPFHKLTFLLEAMKDNCFKDLDGNSIKDSTFELAEPLVYSMFGSKDILILHNLISLSALNQPLNNFTANSDFDNTIFENSIQNFSGFTFRKNTSGKIKIKSDALFMKLNNENNGINEQLICFSVNPFICIMQMKINNSLLFSRGTRIVIDIVQLIEEKIYKNIKTLNNHIINFSFSAYELILTISHHDLDLINNTVLDIRDLKFEELVSVTKSEEVDEGDHSIYFYEVINFIKYSLEESGRKSKQENLNEKELKAVNVFSDTQTTYGIRLLQSDHHFYLQKLMTPTMPLQKLFIDHQAMAIGINKIPEVKLSSEKVRFKIEFKIKPSLSDLFRKLLTIIFEGENYDLYFIPGKSDFVFDCDISFIQYKKIYNLWLLCNSDIKDTLKQIDDKELSDCYLDIKTQIFANKDFNLTHIIRNINTKLYFLIDKNRFESQTNNNLPKNTFHIEMFSFKTAEINGIIEDLKLLNISSHLRNKFVKMYQTHNNGIGTSVTFNLHLDTFYFLKNARNIIQLIKSYLSDKKIRYPLHKIHHIIEEIVDNYENAYMVRAFQPFGHESELEMFINYNSSIQNFISDIDSILKITIGGISNYISSNPIFFHDTIATLDYLRPQSSVNYTNFCLLDVFNPAILFNYMIQESIVVLMKKDRDLLYISEYKVHYLTEKFISYFGKINYPSKFEIELYDVFTKEKAQLKYLIRDWIRYIIFFDDFDKFYFWQMVNVLQNSTAYNTDGSLNEQQMYFEISRLLLLYAIINPVANDENDIKLIFRNYNPFDTEIYPDNNKIWSTLTNIVIDILFPYILEVRGEIIIDLKDIKSRIEKENFSKMLSDSNDEMKLRIFEKYNSNFKSRSSLLIKVNEDFKIVSNYLFTIFTEFFETMYYEFKCKFLIFPSANEINMNKEKFTDYLDPECLIIKTHGGLWFKNYTNQLKYNKLCYEISHQLSVASYRYKMLSMTYYLIEASDKEKREE